MKKGLISIFLMLLLWGMACKTANPLDDDNVEPIDQNDIITHRGIRLGGVNLKESTGSYLCSETGRVYKASEVAGNAGAIDLVLVSRSAIRFFDSPDTNLVSYGLDNVPGGSKTAIINYIETSGIEFTAAMFDAMTDATPLKYLTIRYDDEAFPLGTPRIILFQNAKGLKGVIKVTTIVSGYDGYVEFDLKMQKYPQ